MGKGHFRYAFSSDILDLLNVIMADTKMVFIHSPFRFAVIKRVFDFPVSRERKPLGCAAVDRGADRILVERSFPCAGLDVPRSRFDPMGCERTRLLPRRRLSYADRDGRGRNRALASFIAAAVAQNRTYCLPARLGSNGSVRRCRNPAFVLKWSAARFCTKEQ